MDPDQQLMVQALSGPGMPVSANPDVAQLQAQPNFPKDLSPAALAALFLAPGMNTNYGKTADLDTQYRTVPGESGMYDIMHDSGKKVGEASLGYQPTHKRVYVGYVEGRGGDPRGPESRAAAFNSWAHTLGTKELKSLLRSVAETFPNAETVTGQRISGAKETAYQEALSQKKKGIRANLPDTDQTVRLPRQTGYGAVPTQHVNTPGGTLGVPGTRLTDFY